MKIRLEKKMLSFRTA